MGEFQAPGVGKLRVLVLGYVVRGPIGGMAWHHLQYVAGLARMGHDVYFLEDSGDWPACYDPARHVTDTDPTYGLGFAEALFARTGLADRWGYFDRHRDRWRGPLRERWREILASADLLVNVSGVNPIRPWLADVPVRVLVDTDPGFTQVRHLQDSERARHAAMHTHFLTFGANVGRDRCRIPHDGFPWRPTRQPVVADLWPVTPGRSTRRFTTVMQWDSYDALEHAGLRLGMKADSFGPYISLPSRTTEKLEIALGSPDAPRERLRGHGWHLVDPLEVSRDPWTYQRYLQGSKGEFAVAKDGYVTSWSGWFSERSAGYMAGGRPVVVQDTGFSEWLPTGSGVFAFRTPEEAIEAMRAVDAEYDLHCLAARDTCITHFDSTVVLSELVEACAGLPER